MKLTKPVVLFTEVIMQYEGTAYQHAWVTSVNHPNVSRVTSGKVAITSKVLRIIRNHLNEIIEFETMNTIYKKQDAAI